MSDLANILKFDIMNMLDDFKIVEIGGRNTGETRALRECWITLRVIMLILELANKSKPISNTYEIVSVLPKSLSTYPYIKK